MMCGCLYFVLLVVLRPFQRLSVLTSSFFFFGWMTASINQVFSSFSLSFFFLNLFVSLSVEEWDGIFCSTSVFFCPWIFAQKFRKKSFLSFHFSHFFFSFFSFYLFIFLSLSFIASFLQATQPGVLNALVAGVGLSPGIYQFLQQRLYALVDLPVIATISAGLLAPKVGQIYATVRPGFCPDVKFPLPCDASHTWVLYRRVNAMYCVVYFLPSCCYHCVVCISALFVLCSLIRSFIVLFLSLFVSV